MTYDVPQYCKLSANTIYKIAKTLKTQIVLDCLLFATEKGSKSRRCAIKDEQRKKDIGSGVHQILGGGGGWV
jgi:hypothetical protein